jgi:hypothetical protein
MARKQASRPIVLFWSDAFTANKQKIRLELPKDEKER